MPEPRFPRLGIESGLDHLPIRMLIERRWAIVVACLNDRCLHRAYWAPAALADRFHKTPEATFRQIGPRLHCANCGGKVLWIERHRGPLVPTGVVGQGSPPSPP